MQYTKCPETASDWEGGCGNSFPWRLVFFSLAICLLMVKTLFFLLFWDFFVTMWLKDIQSLILYVLPCDILQQQRFCSGWGQICFRDSPKGIQTKGKRRKTNSSFAGNPSEFQTVHITHKKCCKSLYILFIFISLFTTNKHTNHLNVPDKQSFIRVQ